MKYFVLAFILFGSRFVLGDDPQDNDRSFATPIQKYWEELLSRESSNKQRASRLCGFLEGKLRISITSWWETRLDCLSNGPGSGSDDAPLALDRIEPSNRSFNVLQSEARLKIEFKSDAKRLELKKLFGEIDSSAGIDCFTAPNGNVIVSTVTLMKLTVGRFDKNGLAWRNEIDFPKRIGMFTGAPPFDPSIEFVVDPTDSNIVWFLCSRDGFSSIGRVNIASEEVQLLDMPQFGRK